MNLLCRVAGAVVVMLRVACGRAGAALVGGKSARSGERALRLAVAAGAVVATAGSLLTVGIAPAAADSCPNAQFRVGYSADLPDCRAYELASPADAEPNINTSSAKYEEPNAYQASATGDGIGWFSWFNPADVPSFGNDFLSTRGTAGWSTVGVIPPQSTENANLCLPTMVLYSSDLSKGLLASGPTPGAPGCGGDDPPLVPEEPQGAQNLFVRDSTTGVYQLVNVTPAGVTPQDANPLVASSDLSHVVFDESAQLTADAPAGDDLYEWAGGVVHLVTYLPDGTPVQGSFPYVIPAGVTIPGGVNIPSGNYRNAVSADGSRAVFTANGNLYVRENPTAQQSPISGGGCTVATDACTVQVDGTQGGSGPGGGGQFMWSSADGSEVFFTDDASAGLTASTQAGSGVNLYEYDLSSGTLTDLTPSGDAEVQGVSGVSDDGSYVYFVADGALASGATTGQPNLYLLHAGSTTFVATLAPTSDEGGLSGGTYRPYDGCDWTAWCLTARVSSNGQFIAFNSTQSLTGYDNAPVDPSACDNGEPPQPSGAPCTEIYLYDAAANALSCASCNPSGAPPTGPTWIRQPTQLQTLNAGMPDYVQRNLSDSGQVFFDSPDPLVPQASNGQQNVYEYEGGQLYLLSGGTSSEPSFFVDASDSGDDVFIWSTQELSSESPSPGTFIYDARVDGGFPAPPSPPAACSGDACRGGLTGAPSPPTAASVSFVGPGNVSAAVAAGKVKMLSKVVQGSAFLLRVRVPGAGRITITGAEIRTVRRSVARLGTYTIKVSLTAKARTLLAGKRKLRSRLRIEFARAGGSPSTAAASITVEAAVRHHGARVSREVSAGNGGGR